MPLNAGWFVFIVTQIGLLLVSGCQRAEKVDPELGRIGALSGRISLSDGADPVGVIVLAVQRADDQIRDQATTANDGTYRITQLPIGEYDVTATRNGYQEAHGIATIQAGRETTLDLELEWIPLNQPAEIVYVSGGSNDGDPEQQGVVQTELAQPFVVEVRDAGGTPLSGVEVFFQVRQDMTGGEMLNRYATTDVDGRASDTYVLGEEVGANLIRVLALNLPDEHVDFTAQGLPGPAAQIQVTAGDGQAALVGRTLPTSVGATVLDEFDNPVPDAQVAFGLLDDGQADPAVGVTDGDGHVSTAWTLGTTMGEQRLEISSGDVTAVVTAQADHDAPVELAIAGGNLQSGTPNTPLAEPLMAIVLDRFSNPVDGVEVSFVADDAECSLVPVDVQTTGVDGLASVQVTPLVSGSILVEARSPGLTTVTFNVTGVSGFPDRLLAVGDMNRWGDIGETLDSVTFQLVDQFDNPVSGVYLHFTADGIRGMPGSCTPEDAMTDNGGFATTAVTLGHAAGIDAQWVTASASGYPAVQPATHVFNVFAGPADSIALHSGDDQSANYGQELPEPLIVEVLDAYANPVEGAAVSWSSSTGGSVTPNPSTSDAFGLARVTATLGDSGDQPVQQFTAAAAGDTVTFWAQAVGHNIDEIIPASLPPGYPDPDDPDPGNTLVDFSLVGGGFEAGAVVVWDYWGAAEDIAPLSVTAARIDFQLTADRFAVGQEGVYQVAVRNPGGNVCSPVPFAVTFSVPDSGQTDQQCTTFVYNPPSWDWEVVPCTDIQPGETLYGQDGHTHLGFNQPAFSVHGDGTVTDEVTRLMWTRCAAGQNPISCSAAPTYLDAQDAVAHCQGLSLGGFDDWMLPTIIELQQIADYGMGYPYAMDTTVFPNIQAEGYWSATLSLDGPDLQFRFTAQQGRTEEADATLPDGIARCVRNRRNESLGRFVRTEPTPGEPVVADGETGLMWTGCQAGLSGMACDQGSRSSLIWQDALAFCEDLDWAGHSDWRLPQIKELYTIIDFDFYWPAVDPAIFPGTGTGWHYSSTTVWGGFKDTAHTVHLGSGIVGTAFKDWDEPVLCVRAAY